MRSESLNLLLLSFAGNQLAGDPGRTITASRTRKSSKKSIADVEQKDAEEGGAAEDVLSHGRTRSGSIVDPFVPCKFSLSDNITVVIRSIVRLLPLFVANELPGGSNQTDYVSVRIVHPGSVSLPICSSRSLKRDGPMASETRPEDGADVNTRDETSRQDRDSLLTSTEVEKSSASAVKDSTKSKRKKRKSEQDVSATAMVDRRVEVEGQNQRKKLRSRGVDNLEEQELVGPSVALAKDKRGKRKRADSIRGEEEDATEPSKSKVSVGSLAWAPRIWVLNLFFRPQNTRLALLKKTDPPPLLRRTLPSLRESVDRSSTQSRNQRRIQQKRRGRRFRPWPKRRHMANVSDQNSHAQGTKMRPKRVTQRPLTRTPSL